MDTCAWKCDCGRWRAGFEQWCPCQFASPEEARETPEPYDRYQRPHGLPAHIASPCEPPSPTLTPRDATPSNPVTLTPDLPCRLDSHGHYGGLRVLNSTFPERPASAERPAPWAEEHWDLNLAPSTWPRFRNFSLGGRRLPTPVNHTQRHQRLPSRYPLSAFRRRRRRRSRPYSNLPADMIADHSVPPGWYRTPYGGLWDYMGGMEHSDAPPRGSTLLSRHLCTYDSPDEDPSNPEAMSCPPSVATTAYALQDRPYPMEHSPLSAVSGVYGHAALSSEGSDRYATPTGRIPGRTLRSRGGGNPASRYGLSRGGNPGGGNKFSTSRTSRGSCGLGEGRNHASGYEFNRAAALGGGYESSESHSPGTVYEFRTSGDMGPGYEVIGRRHLSPSYELSRRRAEYR